MKAITKYVADDGSEHASEDKAKERELLCMEMTEVMSQLQARPDDDGCQFSNGHGYIQHYPSKLEPVRLAVLEAAQRYTDHKWIQQTIDDPTGLIAHPSYAGRIISECCPDPIYKAWYRFSCIDKQLREWGQPYYAEHPEDATEAFRVEEVQANRPQHRR